MDHHSENLIASQLIQQGRLEEAEAVLRRLVAANTQHATAYSNLAAVCGMTGRTDELIGLLEKALAIQPSFPVALYNLGNALRQHGRLDESLVHYERALKIRPDFPEALVDLGVVLHEQGHAAEAISAYRRALSIAPNYLPAIINLGVALKTQGKSEEAIVAYRRALEIDADCPEALNNLGLVLQDEGRLDEAIIAFKRALQSRPDYAEAFSNLGNTYQELGKLEAAIDAYHQALSIRPDYTEALSNLGNALLVHGRLEEAKLAYQKAIEINPDYANAQKSLSMALLATGDFVAGWKKYEWRLRKNDVLLIEPSATRWNGDFSFDGELVLVEEQGLGDTLQFIRYAKLLRNNLSKVSLCCRSKLAELLSISEVVDSIYRPGELAGKCGYQWIPLLSVPQFLGVTRDLPQTNTPYLKSSETATELWKSRIRKSGGVVIGVNWQGNPDDEVTISKGRSFLLEQLEPLSRIHGVKLLSLQKGFGSEQLDTCSFRSSFVDCQEQVSSAWDFVETSAIMMNCDLVITSDTSVAHLAGGLGRPTWILLKRFPEWRWGFDGETTAWYPSARLFRQHLDGNWAEVVERVASEIDKLKETVAVTK